MQEIRLPLHWRFKDVFGIAKTREGTFVCPGWHPVPEGTTREQIVFDSTMSVEEPESKPVAKAAEPKSWLVPGSKPGVQYNVLFNGKTWTCSCPASTFQRGPCKHVKSKQAEHQNG